MAVVNNKQHTFWLLFLGMQLALSVSVSAQISTQREQKVTVKADTTIFLADWVKTGSVRVFWEKGELNSAFWSFEERSGQLAFTHLSDSVATLSIFFVEMNYPLERTYASFEPRIFTRQQIYGDSASIQLPAGLANNQRAYSSNLAQKGSLSRGIIVGSNQDFALESGLQFELTGPLTDNVYLTAVLTDRSIPIQPDGTTQNLREFDKVLIQLESERTKVEMGDVDVQLQSSTFARLNRRLQGATGVTKTSTGQYTGVASAVRGTYKTINFQGEDGFQGPYRLTGNNDDEYVIILAGTERVYINGQEVRRGEESEYIIDYGLGEIYFNNNLLIKDETRIFVEYEYVDQNFSRTLIAAEAKEQFLDGKVNLGVTVIRSADSDEYLAQQSLSESDINMLQTVGDNLEAAVVSGVAASPDSDTNILYTQTDTLYKGATYHVFAFSPKGTLQVSFSGVGDGNGAYARASSSANGILYKWVGPGNGTYEPYRTLPAPEQQQMIALNSAVQINEQIQFFGEVAASGYDKNRFSALDDSDNNDLAYVGGVKIQELSTSIGKLGASFSRRYSGSNFEYFDRTKEVEFDRKWNISAISEGEEAITEIALTLAPVQKSTIGVEYGLIERKGFKGQRQASSLESTDLKRANARYSQDWLRTEDAVLEQNGAWFRHQGGVGLALWPGWSTEIRFEQEQKLERFNATDSLLATSFLFSEIGPALTFASEKVDATIGLLYRQERGVLQNHLQKESHAIEQLYQLAVQPSSFVHTQNKVRIRNKTYSQAFEELGSANRQALLIESVTNYETHNEALTGQLFYEANTERQALLQEAYIEVGPELGQYVWEDENEDGVEQIDEFFIELSPNEGTYVRQYLPTDELLPVIDLNARWRNEILPFFFLKGDEDVATYLKGVSLFSRIQIVENSTTKNLEDLYLMRLSTFRNDSTTLQGRLIWEKELDLSPNGEIQFRVGVLENRTLNQQTNDKLTTFQKNWWWNGKIPLNREYSIRLDAQVAQNNSLSEQLSSRRYRIKSQSISPSLEWGQSRSFQSAFSVTYITKKDELPETPAKVKVYKLSNTSRAYLWKKIQATSSVELRRTRLTGESSVQGKYVLTEGTGAGTNVVWSVSGTYRISQMVRFSLNYDGRTVNNGSDIHTVKLVMSAVF